MERGYLHNVWVVCCAQLHKELDFAQIIHSHARLGFLYETGFYDHLAVIHQIQLFVKTNAYSYT